MHDGPVLRAVAVSKRYGRTLALDAVTFEIRPTELFALLGPNGAGKTTLVHSAAFSGSIPAPPKFAV